ncbi:MAG: glycoside hydrolase family 2 protein, partial [Acutalibacteraceae bacterium]
MNVAFQPTLTADTFDKDFQSFDRGCFAAENGVLTVADGWVASRAAMPDNFAFTFTARCAEDVPQVQIWAGFKHYSRDYRYVVALRGGNNNHLYLARMGAEGYDKMLALRPLEFSPMPGVWYTIKVVCAGQKIAVYLGDDPTPLIGFVDDDSPFTAGGVSLGGSYLPTQFKDVCVCEVAETALDGVEKQPDYLASVTMTPDEREAARARARAAYRPYAVPAVTADRLELSLDGKWLFTPDYELKADPQAMGYDDSRAHVIDVPSAWIPLQAWLEGENMRDLNKGMNDNYLVEEMTRCLNQTFDYRKTKSAVYRHYLDLPKGIENKRVVLDFEAIALISAVYFNGVRVNENIGMFAPQVIDVSDYVHAGRNLIAVEVHRRLTDESEHAFNTSTVDDNYATAWDILDADSKNEQVAVKVERREFCTDDIAHGFYMNNPGGIWRSVRLIISDKVHVEDCFFVPTMEDAKIEVTYANDTAACQPVTLSYRLTHKTTGEYLCGGVIEDKALDAGEKRTVSFTTPKVKPHLWGPGTPNLYDLAFTVDRDGDVLDVYHEQVGFRTVKFDGATMIYNGSPIWVRGGNHMPAHVKPTDKLLARRLLTLAKEHNVMATRTHVAPWGSAWLDQADELGVMISLEGTWSWLMLEHIPSAKSIALWKDELVKLVRRHRNRPSLFLMTMNNEMKFYSTDAPQEVTIEKGRILEGGVRLMRRELPHLPLVIDSAYHRAQAIRNGRYENVIVKHGYDDGDMDDPHGYFGWYNPCFFHYMNGEFGKDYTVPGRPCMSQECATGYPRAEDGLPTRAYLYMHQTPQTTVGKKAYEYNDPRYFLSRHGMLSKELVEMFRRVEHDRLCGVILFAFETWFYNQHDYRRIQPMSSVKALKTAYQPVLASADLFGRHFTAGDTIKVDITLINDDTYKRDLAAPLVEALLTAGDAVLEKQTLSYDDLPYFKTAVRTLTMPVPTVLPASRTEARLVLKVRVDGRVISENAYDLLLAEKAWAMGDGVDDRYFYLQDDAEAAALLARYGLDATPVEDPARAGDGRLVLAKPVAEGDADALRAYAAKGGKVILLGQKELPDGLLTETETAFKAHRQEILTMNTPESSVFNGIEPLDTAWFEDGRHVPYVAF